MQKSCSQPLVHNRLEKSKQTDIPARAFKRPPGGERDYQMNAPTRILHVAQNKGVLPISQTCLWESAALQYCRMANFSLSFIFPFFPECFRTGINNAGKTIQYMSGLNEHGEILVLTH